MSEDPEPEPRSSRGGKNPTPRPLVVLDLGNKRPAVVAQSLRDASNGDRLHSASALDLMDIADQIEAQTKPQRIPEPGLWGVVEAGVPAMGGRNPWVRIEDRPDELHWASTRGEVYPWDRLLDPTLIREGI